MNLQIRQHIDEHGIRFVVVQQRLFFKKYLCKYTKGCRMSSWYRNRHEHIQKYSSIECAVKEIKEAFGSTVKIKGYVL